MSARLVHVVNPAAPHIGMRVYEFDEPLGALDALDRAGWKIPATTVLVRDGKPVKRIDWNAMPIIDGEIVALVTFPGKKGGSQILAIVAEIAMMIIAPGIGEAVAGALEGIIGNTAAGIAGALAIGGFMIGGNLLISALMPKPKAPQQQEVSPTYQLGAQTNQARLTQMVPECFGRMQHVLDLAAEPYSSYSDNQQQLRQLFNLGKGDYEIEQVSIGDAVIWQEGNYTGIFPEILLEFVPPGGSVTLIDDNVVTSPDVSSNKMIGTNEKGWGWIGPFVLSKPGTAAYAVEIDVLFPAGLYFQHDPPEGATVEFLFEAQAIDNSGNPTGDYFTVVEESLTLATLQPQSFTYRFNFPTPGRYRVHGRRTNAKGMTQNSPCFAVWGSMRGFLPNKGIYPDCTMMSFFATSDANLNGSSSREITVVKTRKVPIWDPDTETWSENTATRSPAWAAAYIARSSNGGSLADSRVDLAKLAALDATWASRGDNFDGIFDTQQSLYDAIQSVVQVGRTRMIMVGSTMTFVRDEQRTVPRTAFSPRTMLPETFELDYTLPDVNAVQSLAVTYIDERIWSDHQVLCKFDASDDTLETATPITFFGIVDYDHAWREGMGMIAASRYRRRAPAFRTELDGRVCQFGDLAVLSHWMPDWGYSADAVAIEEHDDGDVLTLSEPYTPPAGADDILLVLVAPDGQTWGPVPVTIVAQQAIDPRTTLVKLGGSSTVIGKYAGLDPRDWPVWSGDGLQKERCRALLGKGELTPQDVLILAMSPEDGQTTSISCILDDPRVYAADTGTPPIDPNNPDTAPSVDLVITAVSMTETNAGGGNTKCTFTFNGATDATGFYIAERTLPDGAFNIPTFYPFTPVGGISHATFNVANGATEFQIAAYNGTSQALGPYVYFRATLDGTTDTPPADLVSVTTTTHWTTGQAGVWTSTPSAGALSHIVQVQQRGLDTDPWVTVRTVEIDAPPYTYYPANELSDGGPFTHLRIGVQEKNGAGLSPDFVYSSEDT